ncbi:hypothetical protein DLJ49_20040, partial [Rhodovulum sp. 12E13]
FAGNHGVCAQGVNPFPQAVTAQMVANFRAGGAAINQLCGLAGAELSVVALDLDRPTADFTQAPAMTEPDALAALRAGADAVDASSDVLILGEMGIGNTTVAAALAHALFGGTAADWSGPDPASYSSSAGDAVMRPAGPDLRRDREIPDNATSRCRGLPVNRLPRSMSPFRQVAGRAFLYRSLHARPGK